MKKTILLTILCFLMFVGIGFPATTYVKQTATGGGDGSSCANADDLATVQTTAEDDDIVVLCDDTYTTDLNPSNSGTSGNEITFQSLYEYDSGAVGVQYAVIFDRGSTVTNKDHIIIDGLFWNGVGTSHQLKINTTSSYIEVKNCKFDGAYWSAIKIDEDTSYNYVHDNLFNASADRDLSSTGAADVITIKGSDYNRIIDNTFEEGSNHAFISLSDSKYNIIHGNTINMSRAFIDSDRTGPDYTVSEIFLLEYSSAYNLIEENIVTFVGTPLTDTGSEQIWFQGNGTNYNIVRKNIFNNCRGHGSLYHNNTAVGNEYNMFYNNTFYKTNNLFTYGAVWDLNAEDGYPTRYNQFVNNLIHTSTYHGFRSGRYTAQMPYITDNKWRGNLAYGVGGTDVVRDDDEWTFAQAVTNKPDEFETTIITEPTFVDFVDFVADDGEAPQVDFGAWLTTVDGGTTATTFTVDDYPYMFYWGYGITGEVGDTIKTENGQTGVIASINYGTKQITLTSAITVVDGEGIALDYSGDAPDIGAEEYSATATLSGFYPGNGVSGVPISVDLTWTNGAGITDVHVFFDDADCTTAVVDGDIETYEILGNLAFEDVFYWKVIANPDDENITYPPTGCYTFTTTSGPPITATSKGDMMWNTNAGDMKFNINAGSAFFGDTFVDYGDRLVDSEGNYFVDSEGNYLTGAN